MQFRWEVFNVFNRMTPNNPVSAMNNSDFGKVTSLAAGTAPRIMQFAVKYRSRPFSPGFISGGAAHAQRSVAPQDLHPALTPAWSRRRPANPRACKAVQGCAGAFRPIILSPEEAQWSRTALAAIAVIVLSSTSARAHHGYANFFLDQRLSIEGEIEELRYGNPHVVMKIRTADSAVYTRHGARVPG